MDSFLKQLLDFYSMSEEDFAELSKPIEEVKLIDPNSIEGMDKVTSRIFEAIKNKEKIIVYGDYDCDGISATSIMVKTFQKLNYPVSYYVPSRYIDGYGINIKNVKAIAEKGFNLLILVDNGISQIEEIKLANGLGIDVIVIDHHEPQNELPEAVGIIHPFVSNISKIGGCAGYMSLFVSGALLGEYDPYLVTIAGLSTITDMMELKEYNRDVVRLAISYLRRFRFPKLIHLCEQDIISEKTFGLEIGPKINAIGRMITNKNVNLLVKYLTSDTEDTIAIRDWIIEVNNNRKELTKSLLEDIKEDFSEAKGIVIKTDLLEGLIGLLANNLMNKYKVPTIVFTTNEKDSTKMKGSVRSIEGFNIVEAFEELKDYLVEGGGHAMAGGLTIEAKNFDKFKEEFVKLCAEKPLEKVEEKFIDISLKDINMENYGILRKLAPFGMGFKEPLFKISGLPTRGLRFVGGGNTLSTELSLQSKLLGFNMNKEEVQSVANIDIYGTLGLNVRYGNTLEFRISSYEPSK